ncbi:MAG: hypothetical protein AAFU79_13950, partial [Myxococcota bacterium]
MSTPDSTLHAQQALQLTDLFEFKFARVVFGQKRPRRLELSKTDALSTAGGRQARQNMVLVATQDSGASPIVVGWVDAAQGRCELRSFRMLGRQFELRHGRGIDLEAEAYERLSTDLTAFLKIQKISVATVDEPVGSGPGPDAVVERG